MLILGKWGIRQAPGATLVAMYGIYRYPSLVSGEDVESNVHAFLPRHPAQKFLGMSKDAAQLRFQAHLFGSNIKGLF